MERDPSELPGMRGNPWSLRTPDGKAGFKAFRDVSHKPPALVILADGGERHYHLRCLEDLHEMLKEDGGWVALGAVEEQQEAPSGSVEAWARSIGNPVGGWYGLKKGARGAFARYVPPIMTVLNLAEVEDSPRGGRMRAV